MPQKVRAKKRLNLGLHEKKLLFFLLIALAPLAHAQTGFLSLFDNILFSKPEKAFISSDVPQNQNASKGGGGITIVDGSALMSDTGPLGAIPDPENIESRPGSDQISIYVVRSGDSLSQIAEMFGVSVNTIIWTNDLKRGSLVYAGQRLVILPISGLRHIVKNNDTVSSIAKKYKADVGEIMEFNGLSENSVLAVGETLIIPDGEMDITGHSPAKPGASPRVQGGNAPSYAGFYTHPVPGGRKTQGLHGYNAIDIGAPPGASVLAAAEGVVLISRGYGWNGGYGNYIVIKHANNTQTLYAHLSTINVGEGDRVGAGQAIGAVGSSGRVTGPHLHFEIRGAKNPF
ncbi:peptidoglycan DD-metalloendopeptidase family protein [bacterium]|nr:peptidoglycan DD-metalloendopeptidase family protein [bacterium]